MGIRLFYWRDWIRQLFSLDLRQPSPFLFFRPLVFVMCSRRRFRADDPHPRGTAMVSHDGLLPEDQPFRGGAPKDALTGGNSVSPLSKLVTYDGSDLNDFIL